MGSFYEYFSAADDDAAITALRDPDGVPVPSLFTEEIRLDELEYLEHALTGRDAAGIHADPRYLIQLATQFDEDSGTDECGLVTIPDSVTRAVAESDPSNPPESYEAYGDVLGKLAVVARHAVAHGHHMYGVWME